MKRYDPNWPDNNYGGCMVEYPDGEYVLYEDAAKRIACLECELWKLPPVEDWKRAKKDLKAYRKLLQRLADYPTKTELDILVNDARKALEQSC